MKNSNILFFLLFLPLMACQKSTTLAPSADNLSSNLYPPMGDSTHNSQIQKELSVLNSLFQNKLSSKTVEEVKQALLKGQQKNHTQFSNEYYLKNLYLIFPELVFLKDFSPDKHLWFKAKYLFMRRRFVEAVKEFTLIAKNAPKNYGAQNFRARCLYFLGNPDLALKILQELIQKKDIKQEDKKDSLYLIGAMVSESYMDNKQRLSQGIQAWEQYLALSTKGTFSYSQVEESLNNLKNSAQKPADIDNDFLPNPTYSKEKNVILTAFHKEDFKRVLSLLKAQKTLDKELTVIKGRALLKLSAFNEALSLFHDAARQFPSYPVIWHYRGMAFMLEGKIPEAISSWEKVLTLNQTYGQKHNLEKRITAARTMEKEHP